MPDIIGVFCINTMLTVFHTVMQLAILPACVGYLMPKRVLVLCGSIIKVLLVSLASCFHETFRKVASLRVLNCLNMNRNLKAHPLPQ